MTSRRAALPAVPSAVLTAVLAVSLVGTAPHGATAATRTAVTKTAATTATATAATASAADRRIARALSARATTRRVGIHFSGAVVDVGSNRVVWSRKGATGRLPASTAKLVTATNALTVFGPDHRFTTTVRTTAAAPRDVYLVGSGDPSLSGSNLSTLADQTVAAARAAGQTSVRLRVDDSLFGAAVLAPGWKRSYIPTDVRWVRALVVDGHHAHDTALDAATVFATKLRARGMPVGSVARARTPQGSTVIAQVRGQRLDAMVGYMLRVSDNDHAEALNRLVAIQLGYPGTWDASRVAQRLVLAREGIAIRAGALKDGSGLSRTDRLTALQLARVVDNAFEPAQADLTVLRTGGLPVAGRTGTLKNRFTTKQARCARGKVSAKTGTLRDVVAMAGYTRGRDGRLKAFAFLVNGKRATTTVKQDVDLLAATVNGCY